MGLSQVSTILPVDWQPPKVAKAALRLPGEHSHIRLIQSLGSGGFGVVWLAESGKYPDVKLAVKFLKDDRWKSQPKLCELFRREAAAGIGVTHQHLVRSFEFCDLRAFESEGWLLAAAIVMHYLPYSLSALLDQLDHDRVKLPREVASEWARNLIDGLEHLHGVASLVHRDLKPPNVLIQLPSTRLYHSVDSLVGSQAKIADLGVVNTIGAEPPCYMGQDGWKAPELFGSSLLDWRTQPPQDIWALGKIMRRLAESVEGDGTWLEKLADECMQDDPARRPRASESLKLRASPGWHIQQQMVRGGWDPAAHAGFVGREVVFQEFERFYAQCGDHGGMFLIEAPAGAGKTALLTEWVSRDGPHPAFFFRDGLRTDELDMVKVLFEAICERYRMGNRLPDSTGRYADAFSGLLRDVSAQKLGQGDTLLVFVDALDEARTDKNGSPRPAVDLLPRPPLPRGVFLIVSSRPPKGDDRYLAPLIAAGAHHLFIDPASPQNQADAERFVTARLAVASDRAMQLVGATGGIFQLLVHLIEAIEQNQMTFDQALESTETIIGLPVEKRIVAWYSESWRRVLAGRSDEDQKRLTRFLSLLAASFAPLGETQMLSLLDWDRLVLNQALKALVWLLERRHEVRDGYEDYYLRLRHQTVRDFLISPEDIGPAFGVLPATHAHIGRYYLDAARQGGWRNVEPYGRAYAVRHLASSDDRTNVLAAAQCLTDMESLQATLGDSETS